MESFLVGYMPCLDVHARPEMKLSYGGLGPRPYMAGIVNAKQTDLVPGGRI